MIRFWGLSESKNQFISPRVQEEVMEMFSHCIVREVTQDVSGREQESICLRHVNSDLHIHEDFVGIYEITTTTSKSIAGMVLDVLTRFALPLSNLRAQTYDGAVNMSSHYTSYQARVRQCQPLALYFHFASHISNLVMQNSIISSQLVRNALQWENELGVLMNRSHEVFYEIFIAEEKGETYELDPLEIPRRRCPTKRYTDQVAQDQPTNPEEHHRKQYFEFIDAVNKGLSDRYGLSKSGLDQYIKLENMLTSGKVD
ncbi:Zinc finger MYM-type protein 1-like [Oopsacas minuta]|uniref:Zinc finger MYM-type protein 1-like n=1 Tax=Oopsacas minuta TaxID=111878 RepID=A0AAV7K7H4_9METZ|nr:Zinc finger MYM-type protein 1-like [Oopsacas minuta]